MTAPGPHVTTGLRAGPPAVTAPPVATGFVPVIAGYGPTTPQPVRSASEYRSLYRPDYVDAAHPGLAPAAAELTAATLETFFAEGGQLAYASRLVGPAAVKATHVFVDRQGTPAPALTITAKTPGVWGNDIQVAVADGTTGTTYKLTFSLAGGATILAPGLPIVIDNLATPAAGKAAIDANPVLSALVDVVAGVGVGATNRPAVIAATALSTGADDVVGVTTSIALASFAADLGPGVVFGPALGTADLGTFATGLAAALSNLEAVGRTAIYPGTILGGDIADAAANVATLRASLLTAGNSEERADELLSYVGWFAPSFVLIPGANGAPVARSVPVTGFVAGARARTMAAFGLGRTPAGDVTAARYITGPTVDGVTIDKVNDDAAAAIDAAGGNAIRVIGRPVVYGWRTISSNTRDWGWLSDRDTLNAIQADADDIAEPYTFRKIDGKGQVFSNLRGDLIGMLATYRAADVLYPDLDADLNELDPGYSVDVGPDVNTAATIAAHQINAEVGVRLSETGSTVNISISKVAVGAPL